MKLLKAFYLFGCGLTLALAILGLFLIDSRKERREKARTPNQLPPWKLAQQEFEATHGHQNDEDY